MRIYLSGSSTMPHWWVLDNSELPWQGKYKLRIQTEHLQALKIHLRILFWAGKYRVSINKEDWVAERKPSVSLEPDLLGGIITLDGKTTTGKSIKLMPYAWWVNRDTSPMAVFVRLSQ